MIISTHHFPPLAFPGFHSVHGTLPNSRHQSFFLYTDECLSIVHGGCQTVIHWVLYNVSVLPCTMESDFPSSAVINSQYILSGNLYIKIDTIFCIFLLFIAWDFHKCMECIFGQINYHHPPFHIYSFPSLLEMKALKITHIYLFDRVHGQKET